MIIHVLSAMDVWTQSLIAIFGRVSPDIFPFSSTRVRQQWWLAIPEAKGWFLSWTKGKHHLYIIVSSRTTAAEKKHAVYLPVLCTFSIRAVVWLWPCWHVTTWQLIGRFCWIPSQFIDGARAICSQTAACLDCDGSAVLRAGPFWFFKFLEYPFCMLTWYITVPNESQKEIKQTAWKKQRTNRGVWIRLNQGRPDGLSFRRIRAPATNIAWSLGSWAQGGYCQGTPTATEHVWEVICPATCPSRLFGGNRWKMLEACSELLTSLGCVDHLPAEEGGERRLPMRQNAWSVWPKT
jgi:hypothetical protein